MKRFVMHIQCGIYGGVMLSRYPEESRPDGYDAENRINQALDDVTLRGNEKTDPLAGLLRADRREVIK